MGPDLLLRSLAYTTVRRTPLPVFSALPGLLWP
jgi:hypothetical protein